MILLPAVASSASRPKSKPKKTRAKIIYSAKKNQPSGFTHWLQFFVILFLLLLFLAIGSIVVINPVMVSTSLSAVKKLTGQKIEVPTPFPYPIDKSVLPVPSLTAKSVIALDVNSGIVLYQKDPETPIFPASTTKIMTALVALNNYRLEEVVKVAKLSIDGNVIGLVEGEEITIENLLDGLLVASGNDAAEVLAGHFPGGREEFVRAMNEHAVSLKMNSTHFTNPVGYDENGHYSTAKDLAHLAIAAEKNPIFAKIVTVPSFTITDVSGKIIHKIQTTNKLMNDFEGVKGIKTGWTQNAGECLIALVERNSRKVLTVVLGSTDRFAETKELINWIFGNFSWEIIAPTIHQ